MRVLFFLVLLNLIKLGSSFIGIKVFNRNLIDKNVKIIVASGYPGSEKTLNVIKFIKEQLKENEYKKVIIIKKLKGEKNISDLSIYEKLCNIYKKEDLDYMIKSNIFKVHIMKELFGFEFTDSIIILEDANRYKLNELKLLMTSIDDSCKLIILDNDKSKDIISLIKKINNFRLKCYLDQELNNNCFTDDIKGIELYESDIKRANITKKILEIYK